MFTAEALRSRRVQSSKVQGSKYAILGQERFKTFKSFKKFKEPGIFTASFDGLRT
jgi:hypothetical protein